MRKFVEKVYKLCKGNDLNVDKRLSGMFLFYYTLGRFLSFSRTGFTYFRERGVSIRARNNVVIDRFVTLKNNVFIDGVSINGVHIARGATIGEYSSIKCSTSLTAMGSGCNIGAGVGIGSYAYLGCWGGINIGENTIVGERLTIHSDNHIFDRTDCLIKNQGVVPCPVSIGCDCWIGSNVTILGGVNIGDGCVIGAGSIVTQSIPPMSIAVGNPARVVKQRN